MMPSEFNNILIKMESVLQRYALSLTLDYDDARDLVQDTFVKALKYRNRLENYTNIRAWLCTILRNNFINNYRVNKRTVIDSTDELYYINTFQDANFVSPESIMSAEEIEKAIDLLDNKIKIPFKMYIEGYKYQEIAEELCLKIGTVKSKIFQTRRKLRKILVDYNW